MMRRAWTTALGAGGIVWFVGASVLACRSSARALDGSHPADAGVDAPAGLAPGRCRDASDCGAEQYCDFTPHLCGEGKQPGTCRARPATCDDGYAPVCGCDGRVYAGECAANAAGVDLSVTGGCKASMADWAPCGPRYCDARTSYCEIFLSDVRELPTDYFCRPLPSSCLPRDGAPRACDCFPPGTRCATFCGPLPTAPGGAATFHLTCQGRRPPAQ